MYILDLVPIQLPPNELQAAMARRDEKVARIKEQMGERYLLHPKNIIKKHVPIPHFLLRKENDDGTA